MKIYVDGDGCPVLKLIGSVVRKCKVDCYIYCDPNHNIDVNFAKVCYVEKGANSVDFAILGKVLPGDIVVTNDTGLASLVLSKKGIPISSRGMVYNDYNITTFLNSRHLRSFESKKRGRKQVKGMLSYEYAKNDTQKHNFYESFLKLVQDSLAKEKETAKE